MSELERLASLATLCEQEHARESGVLRDLEHRLDTEGDALHPRDYQELAGRLAQQRNKVERLAHKAAEVSAKLSDARSAEADRLAVGERRHAYDRAQQALDEIRLQRESVAEKQSALAQEAATLNAQFNLALANLEQTRQRLPQERP